MITLLLATLLQLSSFSGTPIAGDPPNITVSSLEPFKLPVGVIITTYDNQSDVIGISNLTPSQLEAAIFDKDGARVSYLRLQDADYMDLEDLPKGYYILRVVDENRNMNMYRIRRNE